MPNNTLRPEIEKLVSIFSNTVPSSLYDPKAQKIQVSHVLSGLSSWYEKVRNVIDYNEEHLLRKNAIQRILKRRIRMSVGRKNMARPLLHELIRGKYIPDNLFPEEKIPQVEHVIMKYLFWLDCISEHHGMAGKLQYFDWIIGLASCEIEEALDLMHRSDALVNNMYGFLAERLVFVEEDIPRDEWLILLYVAIQRSLLKSDQYILGYHLLNLYYPAFRHADEVLMEKLALDVSLVYSGILSRVQHPLVLRLSRFISKHTVYFTILRDVIENDEGKALATIENVSWLEEAVKTAVKKRYQMTTGKLKRSIFNTVIYIFITKIILAFILEVPYELFILQGIHFLPLTINVLFPPLFMFFVASSARVPSTKNTQAIVDGLKSIIFSESFNINEYTVKTKVRRSMVKTFFFTSLYTLLYGVTFGLIVYLLLLLKFNIVSIFLFLLFLCVVSFFGIKIRFSVKELNVLTEREGMFSSLLDFFFLPIVRIGRWISVKFSKVNLFALTLDLIIEAPFKTLIEIVEEWFSFMKEKRDELL